MNQSNDAFMISVILPLSYEIRLEEIKKLLSKLLPAIYERHSDVFLETPYYSGLQELHSSSIDLRIFAKVNEADIANTAAGPREGARKEPQEGVCRHKIFRRRSF